MGSRDVRVRDEYSSIHWVLASIPLANKYMLWWLRFDWIEWFFFLKGKKIKVGIIQVDKGKKYGKYG